MEILEIEQKETLRREEVAKRLRAFADMLERQNDLEFERGGAPINTVRSRLRLAKEALRSRIESDPALAELGEREP